jgi:hypothetical protein
MDRHASMAEARAEHRAADGHRRIGVKALPHDLAALLAGGACDSTAIPMA